jgi:ABC-2 type transport system ATP-binding protein
LGAQVPAIVAEALGKDYRGQAGWRDLLRGRGGPLVRALDAVDLRVQAGEALAVLGENGAGKSTLLRTLAGVITPSRGRALVAGHDAAAAGPALRRDVAYVAGDARSFAWRLSVLENLRFFAALHGLSRAAAAARIEAALLRVGLSELGARRAGQLSGGQRQRLALARGLLGTPRVWLLDEPTAGLDPAAARSVRALMAELRGAGAAVIVATHSLEEAAGLGGPAMVLRGGVRVFTGDAAGAEAVLLG